MLGLPVFEARVAEGVAAEEADGLALVEGGVADGTGEGFLKGREEGRLAGVAVLEVDVGEGVLGPFEGDRGQFLRGADKATWSAAERGESGQSGSLTLFLTASSVASSVLMS